MIPGGAKVIDASGKLVLPGGIDTSVHLEQTFMNAAIQDDFYSGTKVPTNPLVSSECLQQYLECRAGCHRQTHSVTLYNHTLIPALSLAPSLTQMFLHGSADPLRLTAGKMIY